MKLFFFSLPWIETDMDSTDFEGVEASDVSKVVLGAKKRKFPYSQGMRTNGPCQIFQTFLRM